MFMNIIQTLRKIKTPFAYLIGWSLLLFLWYRFLFGHNGIHSTFIAIKIIILYAVIIFIFCIIWNSINFTSFFFNSNSHFIKIKASDWSWTEVTFDAEDTIINEKKRYAIICDIKSRAQLSAMKKHSYSAILIRDGYIKEAIGFIRQVLQDPYIGQLARKITENELSLILTEGNDMNELMKCSVMDEMKCNIDQKFNMSIFGYNKQQVNEFLNELMVYCRNLEEENKELRNDLSNYNKKTQLNHILDISNAKWKEKEYSLLLGLVLQEDIIDYEGNLICNKNTIITSQLIDNLISKGLYGELIAAADPRNGVDRNAR